MFISKVLRIEAKKIPSGIKTFKRVLNLKNVSTNSAFGTIIDINEYKNYIPYCQNSIVNSVKDGMPTEGTLNVQFQSYNIQFTCDVKCSDTPAFKTCTATIVESTTESKKLFEYLETKWTVQRPESQVLDVEKAKLSWLKTSSQAINVNNSTTKEMSDERNSQVDLELSFKFKSRTLQTISSVFGDAVMGLIMDGFKKRMMVLDKIKKDSGSYND